MINVVLADLQNSYYGITRNSVPINIGYIAEYLGLKLPNKINIILIRKIEEFYECIESVEVDIIGFGFFSWNHGLVYKAAQEVKKYRNDCVVVFGGPSVSENKDVSKEIFKELPYVDYLVANEGEQPFYNIVKEFIKNRQKLISGKSEINGCFGRSNDSDIISGEALYRFEGDINEIPSPYLSGRLDKFLVDPSYLPIVQTARGCPYGCTFCVSGRRSWNKMRLFSIDRVQNEFNYILKKTASTYLRLADENFGVLPRDTEIASIIREMKDTTGYPDSISIYTDKHPSERVLYINNLLKDILPFNISFQTLTESVLSNIKRINIKDDRIDVALKFAEKNNLMLVTELIFGLPGETVESFLDSIDKTVRLRFESVILIQLYILKGSEMDLQSHRDQYSVKTKYMISENGYTKYKGIENVEVDEWVSETATIGPVEYLNFNRIIFIFDFMHGYGFARDLMFLFENLGVKPSTLLMAINNNYDSAPLLNKFADTYKDTVHKLLEPSREEAIESALNAIVSDNEGRMTGVLEAKRDLMIDVIHSNSLKTILDEIAVVGSGLVSSSSLLGLPNDWKEVLLNETVDICRKSAIYLNEVSEYSTSNFSYDFVTWRNEKYSGLPLRCKSDLNKYKYKFTIYSYSTIDSIRNESISKRAAYRKLLSVTNSRTNKKIAELVNP